MSQELQFSFSFLPPSDNTRQRWITPAIGRFYRDIRVLLMDKLKLEPLDKGYKYRITYWVAYPDERRRDVNNHSKCLCDALQKCGLIEDDKDLWVEVGAAYSRRQSQLYFGKIFPEGHTWVDIRRVSSTHLSATKKKLTSWT